MDVSANVTLTNNTAEIGGGLAALGTSTAATKVTISSHVDSNTARYGGGLYVGAYSEVTLQNANLQDNTATYGGGAYIDCEKTKNGAMTKDLQDPKVVIENPDTISDEDRKQAIQNAIGTDGAADTFGNLILSNARINNNHLTKGEQDATEGFGTGVYNRGDLTLNAGASASANDRIYLEMGHVATLGSDYTASNQNTEDKLTFNSRLTALGTDIIKMDDEKADTQYNALLTRNQERTTHYQGIPMAREVQNNIQTAVIELNYYTITYHDRFPEEADKEGQTLEAHVKAFAVRPNELYTVVNFQATSDEFTAEVGKALNYWALVDADGHYLDLEGGKVDSPEKALPYRPGDSFVPTGNVHLLAVYMDTGYTGVVINEMPGIDEDNQPIKKTSEIGNVTLVGENLTQNSTTKTYTFAANTVISLDINDVLDDAGHKKGILNDLKIYERIEGNDYSVVGETRYNAYGVYYGLSAVAVMKQIDLANGEPHPSSIIEKL